MTASAPPAGPDPAGAWPHLRALLVTAHIVAVFLLALPDARGIEQSRASWNNPTVQAELAAWTRRLAALGWQTDPQTLQQDVLAVARSWNATVTTLRTPVQFYEDHLGVRQRWRMFVAPHRYPAKLHVDLLDDGRWRTIYEARSPEHDWRGAQLDQMRTRAVLFRYGWERYEREYRALARWIARRAGEDFPSAERVRIRYWGYRTPSPEEVDDDAIPPGEFRQVADVALSRFR